MFGASVRELGEERGNRGSHISARPATRFRCGGGGRWRGRIGGDGLVPGLR